uniref:NR LBD domain-containing protein n=1 Tax=Meloidogyne hapla TaxID=6305 RepID=A0A1I8BL71_MELHA
MQKRVKEEFIHVFHMMLLQNEQSIAYDLEEIFNLIENSSFNDLENSSLIISQISYWALTTFVLNSLLSLNFEDRREITKLFEVEILEPTSILLGILK